MLKGENPQTAMNNETEKPKFFGTKTEKPIQKTAKTAKPKIPVPPSQSIRHFYAQRNDPLGEEF